MSDIFNISISGLRAAQTGLATVSHNVANVNTEGYNRQRIELAAREPQYTGAGFVGRGVNVNGIERLYDEFLTLEIRDTTSSFSQFDRFNKLSSQIDNLLADPQGSLSPALQTFFDSVQDVANDPASTPARQTLLSSAQTLSDRFVFFNSRLNEQYNNANLQLGQQVGQVNNLAQSIAQVNRALVDRGGSTADGQVANDLMDQRDELLRELADLVQVRSVDQDDGSVSVFVGNGQVLVNQFDVQKMVLVDNEYDTNRKEIGVTVGDIEVPISNQLSGGQIGGTLDYRKNVLDTARNSLGRISLALVNDFNTQHKLGMDLNGELGGDFFQISGLGSAVNAQANENNASSSGVSFTVTDTSELTVSDYLLTYNGNDEYTLTRLSDRDTTTLDTSGTYPYTSTAIDGFTVAITGAPAAGDVFRIQPTAGVMQTFDLLIGEPAKIAAANPIRTETEGANTGSGIVNSGVLTDATAYVPDDYSIVLADATSAIANGVAGTITDSGGNSTLSYELEVNGVTVYTQAESDAPLADLQDLADAINGASDANVELTGVKAYVDSTANVLYLANVPASPVPITVVENLVTSAGTVEDGDTVTGYFGSALTGSTTPAATAATYDRVADSYVVVDGSDAVVTSDTFTEGADIAFNGIEVVIRGEPNLGDTFTVVPNTTGISDNKNMLALAALQTTGTMEGRTATYQDGYSALTGNIGTQSNQAQVNRNAQEALLNHALAARSEVSGVNLDEEAVDLLKFQQLYQASARLISTADSMFQELLGVLR